MVSQDSSAEDRGRRCRSTNRSGHHRSLGRWREPRRTHHNRRCSQRSTHFNNHGSPRSNADSKHNRRELLPDIDDQQRPNNHNSMNKQISCLPNRGNSKPTMPSTTTSTTASQPTTTTTIPSNPGDSKNCSDFATHAAAQDWFNRYYPYYDDIDREQHGPSERPIKAGSAPADQDIVKISSDILVGWPLGRGVALIWAKLRRDPPEPQAHNQPRGDREG